MTEEDLFLRALDLPAAERPAFLAGACGRDDALRRRVEVLLAAHDNPGSFLAGPAGAPATATAAPPGPAGAKLTAVHTDPTEDVGTWIGPYKLLQQLGEGGMGTVWVAEQEHPVRRRVALKVIKPGMDSARVNARFEAERQALALMDHTNIAKVLDAGTTPNGRPYFVMELVKGVPITTYCDELHLSVRERLELFVPVCQAVQHAHQKGVIHRDLKPSNVLVAVQDGQPVPKVIDFGVAKALHSKLAERTMYTEIGAVIGTFEYMAPEQAELSALDIDTRADIYALGVLLYELLTGSTPLTHQRVKAAALAEVLRIIREEEPPKPSTRLTQSKEALANLAAKRRTEPRRLSADVRGELDWIVMRALEKDRTRRYETANGLARDIQRYLADEPVEARPASAGYRFRKFVRRNRGRVAAAAVMLLALVGGVIGTTWQAVRAKQAEAEARAVRDAAEAARALAERNFQKARSAVEDYLQKVADNPDLKHNPQSHDLRKQLLAAALPFFEEFVREKSDDPAVRFDQGKAYSRLAKVRGEMGEHAAALRDYATARDIHAKLAADFPDVPDYRRHLAECHNNLGHLLRDLGRRAEAEAAYRQALAIQERLAADFPAVPEYRYHLAGSHNNLGTLLKDLGKPTEAEAAYRRALAIQEKLATDFPAVPEFRDYLARHHANLGPLLVHLGRRAEAEAEYRRALAIMEKLAADYPAVPKYLHDLASTHHNLGNRLYDLGRRTEAEAAYRRALAIMEKLAADYPAVPEYRYHLAHSHNNLGHLLYELGKPTEAEAAYRRALAIQERLAADFPAVPAYRVGLASIHHNLGLLLSELGRWAEAEATHRQTLALREKLATDYPAVPEYRRYLAGSHHNLGMLLKDLGKRAEAEAEYGRALAIQEKLAADFPAVPEYRDYLARHHNNLGILLYELGKPTEAEAAYRRALAIQERLAADFPAVPAYRVGLAGTYVNFGILVSDRGESAAALDWYAKAIPLLEAVLAQDSRVAIAREFLRNAHRHRAVALRRLARHAVAVQDCDRALALDDGSKRSVIRLERAKALSAQTGDHARAAAEAEELTRGDKVSGETLYAAAGVYAFSSAAVKDDEKRQESNAAQAVGLLRRAQAADYFRGGGHVEELKADPDFAALRGREEFQALLKELEVKK
jgi:serine/threonine protein kinase/tetratricopeptide (TPR) repeat protein